MYHLILCETSNEWFEAMFDLVYDDLLFIGITNDKILPMMLMGGEL